MISVNIEFYEIERLELIDSTKYDKSSTFEFLRVTFSKKTDESKNFSVDFELWMSEFDSSKSKSFIAEDLDSIILMDELLMEACSISNRDDVDI